MSSGVARWRGLTWQGSGSGLQVDTYENGVLNYGLGAKIQLAWQWVRQSQLVPAESNLAKVMRLGLGGFLIGRK